MFNLKKERRALLLATLWHAGFSVNNDNVLYEGKTLTTLSFPLIRDYLEHGWDSPYVIIKYLCTLAGLPEYDVGDVE